MSLGVRREYADGFLQTWESGRMENNITYLYSRIENSTYILVEKTEELQFWCEFYILDTWH